MADDLRRLFTRCGVDLGDDDPGTLGRHGSRGGAADTSSRTPVGPTKVPTQFIWGDQDDTVGRAAAEWTKEYIVAPYQFAALPGVGHYAADQVPEQVNALLLAHLKRHPV